MEVIGFLVREWKRKRHWRRTICPHGHYYAHADCQQCPYPTYGYGKKVRLR